jgi:hypothetical protein
MSWSEVTNSELAAWPIPVVDCWFSTVCDRRCVSYTSIKSEFDATALQRFAEANDMLMVPVRCGQARGVAGIDYERNPGFEPNEVDSCWYRMSKFRPLYPEYKDLSDKELSDKLYADRGFSIRDLPNPWASLGRVAGIAFGIPLVVLALGSSLVWAFSGFAAKRN